jgi:hypothetical protein
MGAFFLSPGNYIIPQDVREVFLKQGFDEPREFDFENFKILLYRKQLLDFYQAVQIGESTLLAVGTCFYKNQEVLAGLSLFLRDFIDDKLDLASAAGSYFILVRHNGRLFYCTDKSGIQNIFFEDTHRIASSSFLAAVTALSGLEGKLRLNRDALIEILVTGNLIGPDTLTMELYRYEPSVHPGLFGMELIHGEQESSDNSKPGNFSDAIGQQLKALRNYFSLFSRNIDALGSISGITGGFDSRLLYYLIREHSSNCKLYCTWREKMTSEHICAQKFAEAIQKELHSQEYTVLTKIDPVNVDSVLTENFFFNDGVIRTHQIWLEEIKSRPYFIKLYGRDKLGFSGIGGEQYRNSDYLIRNTYNLRKWVKYELIYKNCGNIFENNHELNLAADRIARKILRILNIEGPRKFITKKEIKRYYNECWNPANRTVRNNVENQLIFFLSPFAEYDVSRKAYGAIPFLGHTHRFEKEMINTLSPELSGIITNYGYAPNEPVPFKYRAGAILKSILGLRTYNCIYFNRKKKNRRGLKELLEKQASLTKYFDLVQHLDLPLSLAELSKNDYLAPLVIEAGIFLSKMDNHVNHD